jgi:hypothetical protein
MPVLVGLLYLTIIQRLQQSSHMHVLSEAYACAEHHAGDAQAVAWA